MDIILNKKKTGKEKLMDKKWKIMVILDACRYDYFRDVYKDYFEKGELKKTNSVGTRTLEWLAKTFSGDKYEDTIYISANPTINSKMIMSFGELEINSREIFFKVIDTWDWGWDESLGTTPPNPVNKDFFKFYKKYPTKRFILHYLQPHMPYIPLLKRDDSLTGNYNKDIIFSLFKIPKFKELLYKCPSRFLNKLRKIRSKLFRVDRITDFEVLLEDYSLDEIKDFYRENLEYVLSHVSKVVENVDEPIIITSDHGEMLGEHGVFGHQFKREYEKLTKIPLLFINF